MNFKTIKTAAELPFKGVEIVKEDGKIVKVIVGGKLHITQDGTYSAHIKLAVPQPYEEAERHQVTMEHPIFGTKTEYFESPYAAADAQAAFERAGAEAKSEKVMVNVDDAGTVVGIVGDKRVMADDDLPF